MRSAIIKFYGYAKGFLLLVRPHILLGWLRPFLVTASNVLGLTKWAAQQDRTGILNDFYSPHRDHSKRYKLYQHIIDTQNLKNEAFDYVEFGVCQGHSIRWWVGNCINSDSRFYGFDTFEGLPEDWGVYNKGDMSANIPRIDDTRVEFVKGLFQDTLQNFLATHNLRNGKRKIIHLDADLFSSTLYALTSLAPYMSKGDILIFDEFNVPNHEFFAFKMFCESYYVKTKLIGAVNNYYQTAMVIV